MVALIVLLLAAVLTYAPANAQSSVTRIMPLGDSITEGNWLPGGFRITLEDYLTGGGHSFDFVGSMANGVVPLADRDHEGHPGFRIDQIAAGVNSWLAVANPDVVMLMIGTNDITQDFDPANAHTRLSSLVDQILAAQPSLRLIVASIPPLGIDAWDAQADAYNSHIPGIVTNKATQGFAVSFADVNPVMSPAELVDNAHPDAAAYRKIAKVWYSALQAVLTAPSGGSDVQLSSMQPTCADGPGCQNGFGPFERDMSNGGDAAGDGTTITLNGQTYASGLGVHAFSTITFDLAGQYEWFAADVGVDDEVAAGGSVVFQAYVGGSLIWSSGMVTGSSATQQVVIPVSGAA
ncbi:MAG TPA: NPCBM/NEW2 domain-containing protein, partial [Ilumatobacter sp.]|nr:NPCBM/NEW2 domain-containing protein [Ilumatobacter sp.]